MIEFTKIKDAKHVAIIVNEQSIASGCALYSYLLTLHKKVSLVSKHEIRYKFFFLPWFTKLRATKPATADLVFDAPSDTLWLYEALKQEGVKFNEKIATSLYASFLIEDGSSFLQDIKKLEAMGSLIESGAKTQEVIKHLHNSESLAYLRLQAQLYSSFVLLDNATTAKVVLNNEMLQKSGASLQDVQKAAHNLLTLVHVTKVQVVFEDKIIYEEVE
ncbi:MAG: hypothetical protein FAF05_00825 [Epsilonproteobacteria bacterium]|nr:hypothetical protein [Campylobacterota bacterium]